MSEWPLVQLRHIAHLRYGDSLGAEDRVDGEVAVFGSNGPIGLHCEGNTGAPVVIVGRKGSHGKVQFSAKPVFAIDTTYFIDRCATRQNLKWLSYALLTAGLDRLSQDVGVPGLSREAAYGVRIPLPPLATQGRIAEFLDTEIARIDALIAKKRRLVEVLDQRVESQISELLGRTTLGGASSSRVELVPLRRVLRKVVRWADAGDMITAFRDGVVTTRAERGREGFTDAWTEGARLQRVDAGDVVVHGLDGFSGAIGDARLPGVCSPVNHVCVPVDGDGAFWGAMLRHLAVTGYLGNFATSTRERAVDFRNWDLFGRIPVPDVPADVQKAIGDEIRRTRPLAAAIHRSEVLANEHRQALITAAVTGELTIPGATV